MLFDLSLNASRNFHFMIVTIRITFLSDVIIFLSVRRNNSQP